MSAENDTTDNILHDILSQKKIQIWTTRRQSCSESEAKQTVPDTIFHMKSSAMKENGWFISTKKKKIKKNNLKKYC